MRLIKSKKFWIICLAACAIFSVSGAFAGDLILQQPLSTGTYFSDGKIIARDGCVVPSGSNVTLAACFGIVLEPGFRVAGGGTLTARIAEPPSMSIQILEPDGVNDWANYSYTIRWEDSDPNSSALISLYYDTDATGADGVLIVSGLSEDPDGPGFDDYVWDTWGIPEGQYYIYAVIDDEILDPVVSYSQGPVTIDHQFIGSDFAKIIAGASATLSWNCPGATLVTIDGIGVVPDHGSQIVSPTVTTTYTITAEGSWGTYVDTITVTVVPLEISITSPIEGAIIDRAEVTVEGTISDVPGFEIGVNVNGILAMVDGNNFVANRVPLEEGQNTIVATAVDTFGHTDSDSITINAETSGDYVRITAEPESGISPLQSTLRIEASFGFDNSVIDYTGPDTVEILPNPEDPSEYQVQMSTPGLYDFTVEVTDSQSNLYGDTVTVLVIEAEVLDGMLKEKWNKMKDALSTGDIPKAVGYISEGARNTYQYNFNLMSAYLAEIASGLQDIGMVNIKDRMAEYDMWAEQDSQMYSFYVLFVKDPDGIWRISFF